MTTVHKISINALSITLFLCVAGCANMPAQNKNTATGIETSATGGAANTGVSASGTVSNTAVMGVIGHEISK